MYPFDSGIRFGVRMDGSRACILRLQACCTKVINTTIYLNFIREKWFGFKTTNILG